MSDQPWRIRTSLIQGPPGPVGNFLRASVAWTPGLVHSGALTSQDVAVAGAALGANAWASWSVALPLGVFLLAQVTATNTVTVVLINLSGSDQTITAGTLKASVY